MLSKEFKQIFVLVHFVVVATIVVVVVPRIDPRSSSDPSEWSARMGVHHKSRDDHFDQTRRIKKIYRHPRYKEKTVHGVLVQPPEYDIGKKRV